MSGSDDRTKLMPTPAGTSGAADDRTRAMPAPGADDQSQAMPPSDAGEPEPHTLETPDARGTPSDAGDSTRALPIDDPSPASSSEDRTRLLGTAAPDDATAVIGSIGADDPTMALAAGGAAAAEPLDDDVTIVRPQAQRRPRLLVRNPAGEVEEHGLETGEATIGRGSSCTLVLANPEVSRKHARILTGPTGSVLHVEGARHNTTVNGELVEGERPLQHGDVLEFASARLVFAETAETPSFEGEEPASEAPRSFTVPVLAAVAIAALGLVAYLLGSRSQPPAAPSAAPVIAAPPVVDTAAQAAAAAEQAAAATAAAREAAAQAVREVAEREVTASRAASREERIGKLLYEGDIALLEDRLTTPPDGSAVYAYSEVLKIDPENEQARSKIAGIIEKYLEWAESAKAKGSRSRSQLYADKAAYIRAQVPSAGDGPALDARITALGGRTK